MISSRQELRKRSLHQLHFPQMELLIHIDPVGHTDEPDNPLVERDEFGQLDNSDNGRMDTPGGVSTARDRAR